MSDRIVVSGAIVKIPTNAGLIVIDVQKGFDDGSRGERNNREAEANVQRLIQTWRSTGRPVFHVHHDSRSPEGSFFPGTTGNQPKPEAQPIPGEPVFHKSVNSGFIGTNLERELREPGIETVVIVGLTTPHCVSTTTRMAGNLGFETYLVEDAVAAFEQEGIHGVRRPAADVHFAALSDLNKEFAHIVSTSDVLEALSEV